MSAWLLEITLKELALDFSIFGVLLVLSTILRRHIKLLQEYLIPNNLIAGVMGLLLAMAVIDHNLLNSERLGAYVYHLLALLFIAFGLRKPSKSFGLTPIKFSVIFIMTYLVQGIIGLALALALVYTIMPDLFPAIGMLLPLSFGMNPGIAFNMGNNWENYGFEYGGTVGLSFAALGFVVAYTVGIIAMRNGIRKGKATYINESSAEEIVVCNPVSFDFGNAVRSVDDNRGGLSAQRLQVIDLRLSGYLRGGICISSEARDACRARKVEVAEKSHILPIV